jgi:hypothetical protein
MGRTQLRPKVLDLFAIESAKETSQRARNSSSRGDAEVEFYGTRRVNFKPFKSRSIGEKHRDREKGRGLERVGLERVGLERGLGRAGLERAGLERGLERAGLERGLERAVVGWEESGLGARREANLERLKRSLPMPREAGRALAGEKAATERQIRIKPLHQLAYY